MLFLNYKNISSSIIPYSNPLDGLFYIFDISNNWSNQLTIINNGKIYFGSNIDVGSFNFLINPELGYTHDLFTRKELRILHILLSFGI